MTERFVGEGRDTCTTNSWIVSSVYVSLLYTLFLCFGLSLPASSEGIVVEEGENKTLNCSLSGSPINWTSPLNESRNGQYFHISNFTCNKNGTYTCRNTSSFSEEHNVTCARDANNKTTTPPGSSIGTSVTVTTAKFSSSLGPTPISRERSESEFIVVLVLLCTVLLVLAFAGVVGVMLLYRRRLHCCCKAYCNGFFSVQSDNPPSTPRRRTSLISVTKLKHGVIQVDDFIHHVRILHTDGDYRFNQEFESLKNVHVKCRSWTHSDHPENQAKNRYGNIVAYDHSRVVLSPLENDPESHYINANYVDSFKKTNAYIATQGPQPQTIIDFWRMVWEQNCTIVVMITKTIEKGRRKCEMYWPTNEARSEVRGPLRITYLDEEAFAFYTVRRFEVKPVDQKSHYCQDMAEDEVKPMIVSQYHFTGWPDHGAPDTGCEYPALSFILKSASASQDGAGPIIVHCSAGVGRSGAYIVIHSMVKRIHDSGDVNVYDFLSHIRQQRNHLVQEECQYIFVHDALLHYIESGFRLAIPIDDLKDYVHKLEKNRSNQSTLDIEFKRLKEIEVKHYNLKQARRGCNIAKNRSVDFLPADSARVELYPRPREEGSDYINASYLPGFWKSQAFIATQYPLEDTTNDFWRMIWQENCRSIVMLISKAELELDYYHSYLPAEHERSRFGEYEVTLDSVQTRGDVVVREMRMASIKDPSEHRNIRHFHFLHWPEIGNPGSGQTILQLVDKVDSWEKEVAESANPSEVIGSIVVHCNYGIGRTGVYCILHAMFQQIAREKTVSVFQLARLYNHLRPHCISDKVLYEFCYSTLIEYIEADCSLHLV
ncbi:receptor-type tyrosine-protein phosphatase gamma-like isoform X3 [Acropora palmata]|uniref:receptor-type tyrosine-protein phosphatase gamma-like isoform X3 n=1 Tax=Acropora palmata TaxID=6131 RepID=UPI003DA0B31A